MPIVPIMKMLRQSQIPNLSGSSAAAVRNAETSRRAQDDSRRKLDFNIESSQREQAVAEEDRQAKLRRQRDIVENRLLLQKLNETEKAIKTGDGRVISSVMEKQLGEIGPILEKRGLDKFDGPPPQGMPPIHGARFADPGHAPVGGQPPASGDSQPAQKTQAPDPAAPEAIAQNPGPAVQPQAGGASQASSAPQDPRDMMASALEDIGSMKKKIRARLNLSEDPSKWFKFEAEAASRLSASAGDRTLKNPEFASQHPDWEKYLKIVLDENPRAVRAAGRSQQTFNITSNLSPNPDPTTKFKTKLMDDIVEQRTKLGQMSDIISAVEALGGYGEAFGVAPRLASFAGGAVDQLPPELKGLVQSDEDAERYRLLSELNASVNLFRVEEFKRLFGTAQTSGEVKNSIGALPDMSAGGVAFKSAVENIKHVSERAIRLSENILKSNDALAADDDAFSAELDARIKLERESEMRELRKKMPGASKEQMRDEAFRLGIISMDKWKALGGG